MANLLFRFTLSGVDDNGVKTNVHQYCEIPEATTGTQLSTLLSTWATAISNLSDVAVTRTEVALHVAPATFGLPSTPGDEEVQEIAGFRYNLTGTTMTNTAVVPAFKETAQVGGKVDITNADVIALDSLLSGPVQTTGFFCSPDGIKYLTRRATFLGGRQHRQQLFSKSFELG